MTDYCRTYGYCPGIQSFEILRHTDDNSTLRIINMGFMETRRTCVCVGVSVDSRTFPPWSFPTRSFPPGAFPPRHFSPRAFPPQDIPPGTSPQDTPPPLRPFYVILVSVCESNLQRLQSNTAIQSLNVNL